MSPGLAVWTSRVMGYEQLGQISRTSCLQHVVLPWPWSWAAGKREGTCHLGKILGYSLRVPFGHLLSATGDGGQSPHVPVEGLRLAVGCTQRRHAATGPAEGDVGPGPVPVPWGRSEGICISPWDHRGWASPSITSGASRPLTAGWRMVKMKQLLISCLYSFRYTHMFPCLIIGDSSFTA